MEGNAEVELRFIHRADDSPQIFSVECDVWASKMPLVKALRLVLKNTVVDGGQIP